MKNPLITNDAVVLGILLAVLAAIFITSSSKSKGWRNFYKFVPALLLCYFVPALLRWPFGLISGDFSQLDEMAADYLLPACLVLLCLNIDFKGILNLGPKALIMFLSGSIGVILGGPIAMLMVTRLAPGLISAPPDELWRGLSTIAGSWIGGGANQLAMKNIYQVNDNLFAVVVVVDVIMANIWMGLLLYGVGITRRIDNWLGGDTKAIDELRHKVEAYQESVMRIPATTDIFLMLAVAFGGVAFSNLCADAIVPALSKYSATLEAWRLTAFNSRFFWVVVLATSTGILLSFSKARQLEGVGASRWGSVFIYFLVATIGMKMDLGQVFNNLGLFAIGLIWMLIHVITMITVAKLIKAPFFFMAVGSQANIGGAASASIVASAFSPGLASVGVLLAVLGYALGTYGGIICAILMKGAAG